MRSKPRASAVRRSIFVISGAWGEAARRDRPTVAARDVARCNVRTRGKTTPRRAIERRSFARRSARPTDCDRVPSCQGGHAAPTGTSSEETTMRQKALILASTSGLLLSLSACETTEKRTADERTEVRQEAEELGQEIRQGGENVAGKTKEAGKKIGEAAEEMAAGRYERFEAFEDETGQTFASRADAAIQRLEMDMQQMRGKTGPQMDEAKDELDDAQEAINEAKKDLAEIRAETGTIIDDGRMGVTTNINQAQRQLSKAYDEMSEAKM
jgi:hypothetical protein